MVSKEEVMAKLSEVEDPELGINIVDLGLVYEVDIRRKKAKEPQKVFIKMTFTTPACPLINEILNDVKSKLEDFKEADIEVNVVFDPIWTIERLSDRARIKLGLV
jgi:metal-sulfur cluster biosynthetic enzyme